MINISLPQMNISNLAILLGEDRITIARELNIDNETEDEIIDEIEEDNQCK